MPDHRPLLHQTAELAARYLEGIERRHVGGLATREGLLSALGGALPRQGLTPGQVIEDLARFADPGVVASAGPRYFGFVTGGALPAALAADWLASAWDQNAFSWVMSPAAAVVEEVAAGWILDLLGLPASSSVGFTSGATMATFTGILAGRHRVLSRAGWDVQRDGLIGAPPLTVVLGTEAHATVLSALQMAGLGSGRARRVDSDEQGRMKPGALRSLLAELGDRPVLVSAQAGNVNSGAFDPLPEIVDAVRAHPNAWLHVDGAFGLWAAASDALRSHVDGVAGADSWTTDAHKWLNVPYDCGVVIVRDADAHRAAVNFGAAYYVVGDGGVREPGSWVPDSSRRARGFAVYAALRQLGRAGVADLVDRCCALARRLADGLRDAPGVAILNDVVLNQVLVRFAPTARPGDGPDVDTDVDADAIDAFTRRVIAAVQQDGTCWAGGTTWHGMAAMRVSVSNWATREADVDASVEAIRRCAASA
ncbi:pyridoxal phosphate-dependent decarboxylase family protein [Roseateles sp. UC29_93]|uniref:pyridoxal phosphate-dependent decarboxylase family protein n=1 Tax=Roseateles sp. UC29_93 TaxID=3350177 RepID=UPI00366BB76D